MCCDRAWSTHTWGVFGRDRGGRSADLIFKRGRREWRRSIRLPFLVVLAAFGLLALIVWRFTPYGGFGAGLVLGLVIGMTAWAWDQPPPFVENWRQGRDGERRTARQLRRLRHEGWLAWHDLRDDYGNVDHLVLGRGGVFLL